MKKTKQRSLGSWAFLIGFVAAFTLGIFDAQVIGITNTVVLWSLIIIGIIIGLFNITGKENSKFLIAGLTLVFVSYAGQGILSIIPQIGNILSALLAMFIPATIIAALKSVFEIAKD